MNEQPQDLRESSPPADEELRQLADRHHELDDRLHELTARPFLSEREQLEEVDLKKKKLQIKDRMESLRRQHQAV